jgi:hypothetical protein
MHRWAFSRLAYSRTLHGPKKDCRRLRPRGSRPTRSVSSPRPDAAALAERVFGAPASTLDVRGLGTVRARGPIIAALQGADQELSKHGIAATARRVGFQAHDGRIFETLTSRGGVLVAVTTDARAADALAVLHSYGGGNAAIGAWAGRL